MDELDELYESPAELLSPVYLDRSTLQRYATCPFQGWAAEMGKVFSGSPEADSGAETHRIIAEAIGNYARDGVPPRDSETGENYLEIEAQKARPDVQADVLAALRPAMWALDRFITSRNPQDYIAYQGGEGEHSGQLAWELLPATDTRGAIMPTSEADLLLAGETETELELVDFKTGHTVWTSTDMRRSFQFRMFAWLIMHNYPKCEYLHCRVFMTRLNSWTPRISFRPREAEDFEGVLLQAVRLRQEAMQSGKPEAWPGHDKCLLCPAALICPRALEPGIAINSDPLAYAKETSVMDIIVNQRKAALREYVDAHGEIVGDGVAFGLNEPKAPRKPSATQYRFYAPPDRAPTEVEEMKDTLGKMFEKGISHAN